jgi:multicomponent Na+:H+ antiporter subunit B
MLVFGIEETRRIAPVPVLRGLAAFGALLYGGTGVASMLLGANFLDYDVLGPNPVAGQHIGIIVIELGVGITVASTMVLLCFLFVARVRQP